MEFVGKNPEFANTQQYADCRGHKTAFVFGWPEMQVNREILGHLVLTNFFLKNTYSSSLHASSCPQFFLRSAVSECSNITITVVTQYNFRACKCLWPRIIVFQMSFCVYLELQNAYIQHKKCRLKQLQKKDRITNFLCSVYCCCCRIC